MPIQFHRIVIIHRKQEPDIFVLNSFQILFNVDFIKSLFRALQALCYRSISAEIKAVIQAQCFDDPSLFYHPALISNQKSLPIVT